MEVIQAGANGSRVEQFAREKAQLGADASPKEDVRACNLRVAPTLAHREVGAQEDENDSSRQSGKHVVIVRRWPRAGDRQFTDGATVAGSTIMTTVRVVAA
jgi:hypothetical protein